MWFKKKSFPVRSRPRPYNQWLGLAALVMCAGHASEASQAMALPETVQFNRDIRPILSDNCYYCHGPDKNKRKAGLRLDIADGLFGSLDGNIPVVPGKPDQSELFLRISTTDLDDLMPAPKSGKSLTPHEIALFRKWILQGAQWEGHWAYLPPVRPDVPAVQDPSWNRYPIDRFVLARLTKEGLEPSPEAEKRVWLRRLSFDLTGLPPTLNELQAFETDPSPDAYERLVDRLLASEHFGERMAMYWLDLVRYADTDGYHADNYRNVWPYRDYVIRAFNENMPFDQFTREQLAGDLLANATTPQKIASTYNRLGRTTEEGGAQAKEYLAKYAADRVRATSTVWLGSTMACAECHDHKFDPFTAKDFYRFAAFFADVQEVGVGSPPAVQVPTESEAAELARLNRSIDDLQKTLDSSSAELAAAQAEWEAKTLKRIQEGQSIWQVVTPSELVSKNGAALTLQDDKSILVSGENPDKDVYRVTVPVREEAITAIRLEVLTHSSLSKQSLSRANGNFVLTEVEVEVRREGEESGRQIKLGRAMADFSQKDYPVDAAIDGQANTGWAVDGHNQAVDRQAAFIFAEALSGGSNSTLTLRLKHESNFKQHNIGRFRISLSSAESPALDSNGVPKNILELLTLASDQRNPDQINELAQHYRNIAPSLKPARDQLAEAQKQQKEFAKSIRTTLATVAVKPREMRVLSRGNWQDDSGEVVLPGVPEFLSAENSHNSAERATRLDLAQWLVSREHPLTARVMVNRLWKLFFGIGICRTLDDLGSQGEWPVHPALVDWLAVEFMESGWNLKHMVKLMVMSQTYRQRSLSNDRLRELDPSNRLLARQSRFRLEAEMVRDNALAVSEMLVDQVGGPSVKPYQPSGYWAQLNFPKRTYEPDTGEALYRRGLYTFWCRSFLHPSLLAFDAPSREECVAERVKSNTPQQALTLLNDPAFVEAARVFAEKIIRRGGGNVERRLDWTFSKVLNRPPTAQENALLEAHYQSEHQRYRADLKAAGDFVSIGAWPRPEDLDVAELAAWASVARVVLNLHETITRF